MLHEGDRAWQEGRRGEARCAWKQASQAEEQAPAIAAMARLRLLRVSGNLGLFRHGPRADRLLLACPEEDPDCRLAWVDRELILKELGLGGRLEPACAELDALQAARPEEVAARLGWASRLGASCLGPDVGPVVGPVVGSEVPPAPAAPSPGTWLLALGATGASGVGAGPVLRFVHPDLGWKGARLELDGFATTGGAASGRLSLRSAGSPFVWTGAQGAVLPGELRQARAFLAPGLSRRGAALWLGPRLSWESLGGETLFSHGLLAGSSWRRGPVGLSAQGQLGLWGSPWAWTGAEARFTGERLASRLVGSLVPVEVEAWRLPAWGGGEVLRAASFREVQAPAMAALVAEWRQPVAGPLALVLFGEGVWAGTPHGGGGLGARLHLPPRPHNTVRLDLGVGDLGWALSAGWGECF